MVYLNCFLFLLTSMFLCICFYVSVHSILDLYNTWSTVHSYWIYVIPGVLSVVIGFIQYLEYCS